MFTAAILSAALWQTTWFAAPQPTWDSTFVLPTNIPVSLSNQTVREVVRSSVGGRQVRVQLSNRYGSTPLTIGAVRIALARDGGQIDPASERALTFNGSASVVVPAGAPVLSDPIDFVLKPLTRVAVSTDFPAPTPVHTFHWGDQQTAYVTSGNAPAQHVKGRLFLTSLLVDAGPQAHTVIALGDSITDGNGSTPDANRRWPDLLAQRLAPKGVAVVNAGISGARLLGDKMGANALARFEQDVLAQPGAKTVIVLLGINDIGWPGSPFAPGDPAASADQLIAGYRQLITLARTHQVRIVGATLPPFEGALAGTPFAGHFSTQKERVRMAVNHWLRTAGAFDAVVDFDAVLRDPGHPARLLPAYDSGDHLHPGDAGYQAMAAVFEVQKCSDDNNIITNCISFR
ncbi:SGNH/GDSL hydrolase family protein [Massilia sp. S19_KUP03_FR1]|uniref:SGNH/GDSL hydrolase family protein n=1 Tax=Massilia sp. S19_KUP03_FR1 TaxID=3025503 RepID=UPI002FCD075E